MGDNPKEDVDRRGFVTPLTEIQDEANEYEGSMVGCSVAVRLGDLPLTQRQKERLLDIVGPSRVDEDTGVIALEVDDFPERNHNAALLGDMLEQLLREAA